MYKYEFVNVPIERGLRSGKTDTLDKCEKVVIDYAKEGWRFVQILTVTNEKSGVSMPVSYRIIFEKEVI